MIHITNLRDGLDVFKSLGSEIRIEILETILKEGPMNMNSIASRLNITSGSLTGHIKKLEECGLITISNESATHGNQKICSIAEYKVLLDFEEALWDTSIFNTHLRVGHYTSHEVFPTCGLATSETVVGSLDDVRYFNHPDRYNADILWFSKGYVEYTIPNLIPSQNRVSTIAISMEISSEAPGINNNWPSDISFYINDVPIGVWTSPGDFGDKRGLFTPMWWSANLNQYGLLKILVISNDGTYMEGIKLSDISCQDLNLDYNSNIRFKIAVEDGAKNIGGLTIFGKSFGNYDQDIDVSIHYVPIK